MAFDINTAQITKTNGDNSLAIGESISFGFSTATPIESSGEVFRNTAVPSIPEYVKYKYDGAYASLYRGAYGNAAMQGRMDDQEALAKGDKALMDVMASAGRLDEVYFREAPVKFMLGETAQLMPFMLSGAKEATTNGLVGAFTGGFTAMAIGVAGPQAATLEEAVTVPALVQAGFKTGAAYGVIKHSIDIEGGNLYLDMIAKGIDPSIARLAAIAAGLAIGALETMELNLLAAPFRRAFAKQALSKPMRAILLKHMATYATAVGWETTTEELQEVVGLATESMAAIANATPEVAPGREEWLSRMGQVLVSSLAAFPLIQAPGAIIETTASTIKARKNIKDIKARIKENLISRLEQEATEVEIEKQFTDAEVKVGEKVTTEKQLALQIAKATPEQMKVLNEQGGEVVAQISQQVKAIREKVKLPDIKEGEAQKITTEGRVKKLETDFKAAERELDLLAAERDKRIAEGKPVAALENKIQSLNLKAEKMFTEKAELLLTPQEKVNLSKESVEVRASKIQALEARAVKQVLASFKKGAALTQTALKREVKTVQRALTSLIKKSGLDAAQKSKFLDTIKNVQTVEQLRQKLPAIQERVDTLIEKAEKRAEIAKFKDFTSTKRLRTVPDKFRNPIMEISEQFDPANLSDKKLEKLLDIADALLENPDTQLDNSVLQDLKRLSKIPLSNLKVDDIKTINASIGHLLALNEQEGKMFFGEKLVDFNTKKKEIVSELQLDPETLQDSLKVDDLDFAEDMKSKLDRLPKKLKEPVRILLSSMFGIDAKNAEMNIVNLAGRIDSTMGDVLFNQVLQAYKNQIRYQQRSYSLLRGVLAKNAKEIQNRSRAFKNAKAKTETILLSGGRKISDIALDEKVDLYLTAQDKDGRRHLLNGKNVTATRKSKSFTFTEKDIQLIEENVRNDKLAFDIANVIQEYYRNIQKEEMNKTSLLLWGYEVARSDTHHPLRTNDLNIYRENLLKGAAVNTIELTTEDYGFLKPRLTNAKSGVIIGSVFTKLDNSIRLASAFTQLAPATRSARAVLRDNDVRTAFEEQGKQEYLAFFEKYLQDVEGVVPAKESGLSRLITDIKNTITSSILSNLWTTVLKQVPSYVLSGAYINPKLLATNYSATPSEKIIAEINEWIPETVGRFRGRISRDIGATSDTGRLRNELLGEKTLSQTKLFSSLTHADKTVITSIWRAAKEQVSQQDPTLRGDAYFKKVAELADLAIRRTQPTADAVHRSGVSRSNNILIKLGTLFSNQLNKNFLLRGFLFAEYNTSQKTFRDKGRLLGGLTLLYVVSNGMIAGVNAVNGLTQDKEAEELARKFFADLVLGPLNQIYFLGPIATQIESVLRTGRVFKGNVLTDASSDAIKVVADLALTIKTAVTGEKYRHGRNRGEKAMSVHFKGMVKGAANMGILFSNLKGTAITLEALLRTYKKIMGSDTNKRRKRRR